MATTIRQLTLRARAEGIRETSTEVRQLGAATDDLANKVAREASVRERADRLLAARERLLNVQAKAAYDLARATDVHTRALEQNLITQERYQRNIAMERARAFAPVQRIADRSAANADAGWGRLSTIGAANLAGIEANNRAEQMLRGLGTAAPVAAKSVALPAHEMRNLGFQINDVATMLAMGQSPFMILASQGGQLVQILGGAQGGVVGVLKQVGTTILGWLTPLNMVIAGMVAATGAIAAWSLSGRRAVESLDQTFERHARTIREIKGLYGDAADGLGEMVDRSKAAVRALAELNAERLREQLADKASVALRGLGSGADAQAVVDPTGMATGMAEAPVFTVAAKFAAYRAEIEKFYASVNAGKPDVLGFLDAVDQKAATGLLGPEGKKTANDLREMFQDLEGIALRLPSALDAAQGSLRKIVGTPEWDQFLLRQSGKYQDGLAAQRFGFDLRDIQARTTSERASVAADRARAEASRDSARAAHADAEAQRAASLVYAEAAQRIADADRERALAMRQRFDAARADIAMMGQSVAVIEAERFRREQLVEIERDALQNGEAWARRARAAVDDLAEAWGRLAGKAAEAKLADDLAFRASQIGRSRDDQEAMAALRSAGLLTNGAPANDNARRLADTMKLVSLQERQVELTRDLQFEREQIFRSDLEGQIAERLRSLNIEAESAYGRQVAEVMRLNEALKTVKDTLREPFTSFLTDLSDGKGFKEAAANAAKQLGSRMAEQGANALYDSLWSSIGSAVPGLGELGLGPKADGSSAARALWVQIAGAGGASGLLGGGLTDALAKGGVIRSPLPQIPGTTANDNYLPKHTGLTGGVNERVAQTFDAGGWLTYSNQSATRSQPLDPRLVQDFAFLKQMGVRMDVFSGGQPGIGSGLPRVGSTRHDHGNAADVMFYKDGRALDWRNPADVPTYQEIVSQARANGVTGFGAGPGYMRPGSMHVGYGAPGVWGAGGQGANAPGWLRDAYAKPAGAALLPGMESANDNLQTFSKTAADSTQNLGSFGSGLGQLGQALGSAAPAGGVPSLGGGGDPLSGLLMGGISLISKIFGFSRGGFTGAGGVNDPAGMVHKGEVVWSQMDVARAGGVAAVEAMRLGMHGYAEGGVVGGRETRAAHMPHATADAAAPRRPSAERAPLSIRSGDVIVQGDANRETIAAIRKEMSAREAALMKHLAYERENEWRRAG